MIPTENKKNEFLRELEILHYAGVGVILCRTREANRCLKAIGDFAFEHSLAFRTWNCCDGWKWNEGGADQNDGNGDALSSIQSIIDYQNQGTNPMPEGVYVMEDLHYILEKTPHLIRAIKDYAVRFSNSEYRLVIMVPETFVIPDILNTEVAVIDFELPSRDELSETLDKVIRSSFTDKKGRPIEYTEPYDEAERTRILNAAIGMTSLEAETAMAKSIVRNEATWPDTEVNAFAQVIMMAKTEIVKRSECLELHKPLDPASVGGYDLMKDWFQIRTKAFTPEAEDFGVVAPKGALLVGVPGTGKSISARMVAHILGMPIIRFDISKVFGSLVGQTEQKTAAALRQLKAMAPCVAWIDEVDKAGIDPRQGGGDSGTSKRVMMSLLTTMAESTDPIFWLFTANRTDSLPPELLRKGRLEELFCVNPPNRLEREEILKIHLLKRNQDPEKLDLSEVISESKGYVGAELEAAVNSAVTEAFFQDAEVDGDLILTQLKSSVPIKEAFSEDFEAMEKWATQNARPASTPDEEEDVKEKEKKKPTRKVGRSGRRKVIGMGDA